LSQSSNKRQKIEEEDIEKLESLSSLEKLTGGKKEK